MSSMKQSVKLPNIEQKEPLLNEMRHLIKNTEDIKSLMQTLWQDQDTPSTRSMDKVAEEVRKQRRVLGRLVQTLETEAHSAKGQSGAASLAEGIRSMHEESPARRSEVQGQHPPQRRQDESHMKKILEEHQKMLKAQTEILLQTKKLIERVGTISLTMTPVQQQNPSQTPQKQQSAVKETRSQVEPPSAIKPVTSEVILTETNIPLNQPSADSFELQLAKMQEKLQKSSNDIRCVQEIVGSLFRQATIRAFESYSHGMPQEDMKIEFAEEILNRYRQYIITIQRLKGYDVATIEKLENLFESLGRKTLEFLLCKYPQSKKKISDAALARHIKEVRKLTHPQYDMLRNGNIDINLNNLNQGLNKQLKTLINALIKETNRYYETYKKYMTDIFLEQEKLDPSFSFLIGRKIKQTTQEYTEEQLNTPGFFIKNNEILRILIKWIEQLISWFTDPKRTLDNQFGFKYENQQEKLGVDKREDMWNRFQESYSELKKDFNEAELFIKRTLSSIIGISKNEIVGKYTLEPMAFLSRKDILIPLICKYVSDTLQCYAVQLINSCLSRTYDIMDEYASEHSEIAGFSLYSCTVNDLLRCKCTGKKVQIMQIYDKLRELQNRGELAIIMVKNRLSGPTQDILITYKLNDCFLLCEIQLALSTVNEEINDHFNHFLYEQHRSRHGIICELAMMLNTLDVRRKYFSTNKLSFLSPERAFRLEESERDRKPGKQKMGEGKDTGKEKHMEIVCNVHPKRKLQLYKNDIPYMCGQCCRFIDAFRYYMASKQCKECFRKLCPPCYMRMLPKDEAIKTMLEPLPMLKGYFKACEHPCIEYRPDKLDELIKKMWDDQKNETDARYLLMVIYKNNLYNWTLRLVKIYEEAYEQQEEQEQDDNSDEEEQEEEGGAKEQTKEVEEPGEKKIRTHILEAFTNKTVDLTEYDGSMVLFMKPESKVTEYTADEFKSMVDKAKANDPPEQLFEYMYELQDEWEDDEESKMFTIQNVRSKKKMIVDYSLTSDEIDEMMSDHRMRALVQAENSAKNGRLVLKSLALDFKILQDIKLPDSITYLEIAGCYEPESCDVKYEVLNHFKNIQCFYIQDLDTYTSHHQFVFNDNLEEIGLSTYVLETFKCIPIGSKRLKVLDLSNNEISEALPIFDLPLLAALQLQKNKIAKIEALTESNLPNLDRLDLSDNQIDGSLPILNLPKLRVLVLNNNKLKNVSNILESKLESLKMLHMKGNYIQGVVPDLGKFPKLSIAELQSNNFTELKYIRSESLLTLCLQRNQLKGQLCNMDLPNATKITLSENMLTGVNSLKDDCRLDMLQTLTLFDNRFDKFPSCLFPELIRLDIEPEKMKFKVDPNRQNDNNELDNLNCGSCQKEILTYGCDYDLKAHHYLCKDCMESADPKPKTIVVCMVLGSDLQRYA